MSQPPKTIDAVRPNAGVEAAYRARLRVLVEEMHQSWMYWVTAAWRKTDLAQDAGPTRTMQRAMERLAKDWQDRFDAIAPDIARRFTKASAAHYDRAMMAALKKAGFTVKFKPTRNSLDAYAAVSQENVNLIKSIASEYLTDVQTQVWRAVNSGYDLKTLRDSLQKTYGVTEKRATLIARDQSAKANAAIESARRLELGITEAIWMHSAGGKEPRPSHVAASGKRFKVAEGMVLDGERVWPGTAINCFPGRSVIEHSTGVKKLWRRRYGGELTTLVTESGKVIEATPNHPVLTDRGWVAIKDVHEGDNLVAISDQVVNRVKENIDGDYAKIAQIFDSVSFYITPSKSSTVASEFHGDASHGEVETVDLCGFLPNEVDSAQFEEFAKFFFARAGHLLIAHGFQISGSQLSTLNTLFGASQSVICGFGSLLSFIKAHSTHADDIRLGLIAKLNAIFQEASLYCPSVGVVFFGEGQDAQTADVVFDDRFVRKAFQLMTFAARSWQMDSPGADEFGDRYGMQTDNRGGVFDGFAGFDKLDRVVNKGRVNFDGHVYNLETWRNWYSCGTYIVHNCRCVSKSIIPGL